MTTKRSLLLATLCAGLLAAGAFAAPVLAKPGPAGPGEEADRRAGHRGPGGNWTADGPDPRGRGRDGSYDDRVDRSALREDRHERMRAAHDAWQVCRQEARNASGNASLPEACGDAKSYFLNATHALREAHAVSGAIAALERQVGRLEVRQMELEGRLASGNLSANETADGLQRAIDHLEALQQRLAGKLEDLRDRLEDRQARWSAVRDYVEHRRGRGSHEGAAAGADGTSESGSPGTSAASPDPAA